MSEHFTPWDAAEHLETEEDIALYLEAAQEEAGDDPAFMTAVLADIARARNMSRLAQDAGLTRAGLYKALAPGANPGIATVHKIAHALGLRLTLTPDVPRRTGG